MEKIVFYSFSSITDKKHIFLTIVILVVALALFLILWYTLPATTNQSSGSGVFNRAFLGHETFGNDFYQTNGNDGEQLSEYTLHGQPVNETFTIRSGSQPFPPRPPPPPPPMDDRQILVFITPAELLPVGQTSQMQNFTNISRINQFSFSGSDVKVACVLADMANQRIGIQAFSSCRTSSTCR